jgi:type I restriction enzyme M protein
VLPQGKFNNSSLAFIREWILKKARLLAVVGLHPNTFKPHTGTKTSVLFVQKYTQQQLDEIAKIHDEVAVACPDYEATITNLLDSHTGEITEDLIPEAITDLLAETFAEPEAEEVAETNGEDENGEESDEQSLSDEDLIAQAEEKLDALKAELIGIKQKLLDMVSDSEALLQQQQTELTIVQQQQQAELDAIQSGWTGKAVELKDYLKPIKAGHKKAIQDIKSEYSVKLKAGKERQKTLEKSLKAEQKRLEKLIPEAERGLKLLSLRGKLELVLADADLIGMLKEHWIAAEVAKRLDYPIFMAVSERGGKDNSGDYLYVVDDNGNLVEDHDGQPKIDQDLVNYDLTADDLADAATIPDEQLCIAEAFVRFAQEQGLNFWMEG